MDQKTWAQANLTEDSALVPIEGERHRLFVALIIGLHHLKPKALDLLEMLYTEQEKSQIDREVLRQLPEYLHFLGTQGDALKLAAEHGRNIGRAEEIRNHRKFMKILYDWLEETGLGVLGNDMVDIGIQVALSVVMSLQLYRQRRTQGMQQFIMYILEQLRSDVKLEGASIPRGMTLNPPLLPIYFPFGETKKAYKERCNQLLTEYISQIEEAYQLTGSRPRQHTPAEEKHIQLLARRYAYRDSIDTLAMHFGMSKATVHTAIQNMEQRMGITRPVEE